MHVRSPFRRLSQALALTAALAGVFATTTVFRSYVRADGVVHEPRNHVTAEATARAYAEIPRLEDATLRTSDGLTLRGWFAPGTNRAVVILTHGGGGNRVSLYPEARLLSRHGYGILLYDSRACGESDGDIATRGDREQRDVAAALDYVSARPDVDRARIALFGFSIGASSVALTAAGDPRPRAVILGAVWSSLEDEIKHNVGTYGLLSSGPTLFRVRHEGVDIDNVRPIDRIGAIGPRPILMLAGSEDGDTPLDVMQRVFAAAAEPKALWILWGVGHGGYFAAAPAEFESRVIAFLDHALAVDARAARP